MYRFPLAVLSVDCLCASLLLPEGVNKVLVTRSARYVVPITLLLWGAFLIGVLARRLKPQFSNTDGEGPSASDLVLLLLTITPVVQYLLRNTDVLFPLDPIPVLGLLALLPALLILGIPRFLRRTGSTRIVMYLGLAFAFSITNTAALANHHGWHERGRSESRFRSLPGCGC